MATEDFKRKLTAVMSADVAGYSRLMAEDEAATVKTIATYREVMATLIKQHRGRVVDSPGDNVLAEFASVVDAVQCAVAVQKEFQARNAALPEHRKMEFRIGINLGDVIEEEERIYGDGVNIAARLEALADPGGICVSKTAFDQIETKLPLGYEYLGEQDVKNIPKPVGAYRVLMEPRITVAEEIEKEKGVPFWQRKSILAGGVAFVLVVIAALIWNLYFRPPPLEVASQERMAFPLPDKPSIAVLPFVNVSNDSKQEYLADGITENILSALSQVPKLFVIARNSTYTYKGKPVKVQKVAEDLGVQYVLEGSVQRSGDSIRVTAQLIDALTAHHLWSERYDRELKDIFALQDEITMKILIALEVQLTEGEQAAFRIKTPSNLDAYLKYLQAREYAFTYARDDNIKARKIAEEIISLDPNYHMGYSILATVEAQDVWLGISKSPKESLIRAMELAKKSIAIEDTPGPHRILAAIYVLFRKYDEAIVEAKKSLEMDPSGGAAHMMLGHVLLMADRAQEAIPILEKAIRLNPYPPSNYFHNLAFAYLLLGKHEEAINAARKAIRIQPKNVLARRILVSCYSLLGREEEARAEASEVLRIDPNFSIDQSEKRTALKNKHQAKKYYDSLCKAGLPETPPLPLPDKPSIAVLPFVNMSGDPEQEYFSDGITEEIITALSRTPKLFVIARNSSFTYKGKSVWIPKVGRELGVKYVLEGSVRKAGKKVRVTAQLVDAKTANHLWADRWDRELEDIFAVQDEITKKIITELQVKLTAGEDARLWAKGTDNLEAYLKYLQGLEHKAHFNKEENVLTRRLAEEAIALDPQYSHAYTLLGLTHMMDVWLKTTKSPKQSIGRAIELAKKAIALDSSNAAAYGMLGFLLTMARKHEKGIAVTEKAVALDPNSALAHQFLGLALRFGGRPNEAIPVIEKAIRLDPFAPSNYIFNLGLAYLFAGQHEAAIQQCKKATDREPNNLGAHLALAVAYSVSGRDEEARAVGAEILRIEPKFSVEYFSRRLAYKNEADKEIFITALRKAGLK